MPDQASSPLFERDERFRLDASSPVPLYHQIEQILLERIGQTDSLGSRLPSEKDLMEVFGVGRATVKRTLDNLAAKGLLERRRALGTRVVRQQITENLTRLTSYSEEMCAKSLGVRTRIVEAKIHAPTRHVRDRLQLAEGEKTLCLKRLRGTIAAFPVVFFQSEIPVSYGIQADEDFSGSLYRLIEETHGIPIECAEEEICAAHARADEARLLGIRRGDCVLVLERVTRTRDNHPLEFVRGVYRPEHYKFSIRLRR